MEQRLYKDLVWLYPILTPYENYEEEARFFLGKILKYSETDAETLLDIGFGPGHTHHYFRDRFKVTGIDLNPGMLEHGRELNPDVEYIQGDMRTFRLGREFDVVTMFDGICYMTTEADLRAAFETAYLHLKPGGLFMTYVEDEPDNFVQDATVLKKHSVDDIELTYIMHFFDPDTTDTEYEKTFIYLIRKNGVLDIQADLHRFGIFPIETWIRLLEDVGFTVRESIFTHSEFEPGDEMPLLIGIKE